MNIYKQPKSRPKNNLHRKIWEQHCGQIPVDCNGRTYDIHHIDGNPHNNDISNLKAVSIQEHYDIHLAQGDWSAALLIAERLSKSLNELATLSSLAQKQRLAEGTHHFGNSEWQRQNQLNRVAKGTHPFIGGDIQRESNNRLVKEGSHNFQGDRSPSRRMVANGTSHLLGDRNPSKLKLTCPHCNLTGGGKSAMFKWHFDMCKQNPNRIAKIIKCNHCGLEKEDTPAMRRVHFDNCRHKP